MVAKMVTRGGGDMVGKWLPGGVGWWGGMVEKMTTRHEGVWWEKWLPSHGGGGGGRGMVGKMTSPDIPTLGTFLLR